MGLLEHYVNNSKFTQQKITKITEMTIHKMIVPFSTIIFCKILENIAFWPYFFRILAVFVILTVRQSRIILTVK